MCIILITQLLRFKSVRNRCVIEVFGGIFMLSRGVLDFSVGVIGLSQIASLFSIRFGLESLMRAQYP